MRKGKLPNFVFNLIEPVVLEQEMELVEVEFVQEGAQHYLRLFIDKEGGVNLDDCEKISHLASLLLEQEDPIKQSYVLEVSSPGLTRPLKRKKDFIKNVGKLVEVRTYAPFEGSKKLEGELGKYSEINLNLIIENKKRLAIPWEKISQVKLKWR